MKILEFISKKHLLAFILGVLSFYLYTSVIYLFSNYASPILIEYLVHKALFSSLSYYVITVEVVITSIMVILISSLIFNFITSSYLKFYIIYTAGLCSPVFAELLIWNHSLAYIVIFRPLLFFLIGLGLCLYILNNIGTKNA